MRNQNLKNKILNMKGNNGITLVALIITIIVLLILAVVAISAVNNTGIINQADNSVAAYKAGRDNENTTLQNYMDILNHYNNPPAEEEILWMYDEKFGYAFIGNVKELILTEDKEIKVGIPENEEWDPNNWEFSEIIVKKISEIPEEEIVIIGLLCSIEKLTIGENIIDKISMYPDADVKEIVFLEGCSEIGTQISGTDTIETVTIPESVTSIDSNTFSGCNNLMEINFGGSKATWNSFAITGLKTGTQINCSDGTITV